MKQYSMTIGIDLGDEYSAVCVLDEAGEIVEESRVRTTRQAFARRFTDSQDTCVVMESGTHSRWAAALLEEHGFEVIVANARRLRMIFANENKTDRVDARMLARVARFDKNLLSGITHRNDKTHAHLELIRSRSFLVDQRTSIIVRIRGIVKSFGHRLPSCSAHYFARKTRELLPDTLTDILDPFYDILEQLNDKIKHFDTRIERIAQEEYAAETELLRAIPGVGPLTSMTYILTIENPRRFTKSRHVASYFGLRPRLDQSGQRDLQLPITKCGDSMMRRLLVQAAHHILGRFGPDCDLKRFGQHIADGGGTRAKKRAVIAVARKLSVLLHRLWVNGEVYDPFHNAKLHGDAIPTP